ncbi:DEAD/DEAH box helicase family protein [Bradyrhizobium sp. WSM1417]|uniref:DEAD/DEAH box helicase family protein n=1 Tax=Bradyrhizobium sp. WSM1417 TaxID=754500 RepID=UPI0004B6AEBD|nr:DEAD/DEAH box helicase family protein [Bradyrhizobium sp. WSM1417]
MATFDFNSLNRPAAPKRPTNPIEIFRSAPALAETPNDLWQGQSKALEMWHSGREKRDTLISLHTGAGKSIVGLLIAQSLIHEGVSKVLYVCATNDLVAQTSREVATKLGFVHSTRVAGKFSNDSYSTGAGFCLTNYQALFNSRTVFARDHRPAAIIFDDAHVAEKIIRDSFTIRIERSALPAIFDRIVSLSTPHFEAVQRRDYFQGILKGDSAYRVALLPPGAVVALTRDSTLLALLQEAEAQISEIRFPLGHLADHLNTCSVLFSQGSIEICPAFLPSKRLSYLADPEIRRIYLSATLTSEVDFCRAFGRRPANKIEPESDAGMGERLIILTERSKLTSNGVKGVNDNDLAHCLSARNKLLISTPSYPAATKYRSLATPPSVSEFSIKLDQFRRSSVPSVFILVGRVDGIDLPHNTCRVMLADGLPTGFSLIESYLYDTLEMRNSYAAKLANRITQMFGRTNRGRNDYSTIFAADQRLVDWLSTPRNVALLPELLRKQLLLGKSLVEQFKIHDLQQFPGLIDQVVGRDAGWLRYYQDSVSGLDISAEQKALAAENDSLLTEAAMAEADFAAHMWDGNASSARDALAGIVDRVVVADRRLSGWYNIQLGHTFELQGDIESAAKQYSQARSRIHSILALPFPATTGSVSARVVPANRLHSKLLEIFANDIRHQNDQIAKVERSVASLFDNTASVPQHEEAMRALGDALGFIASRPEQEQDNGSTLDVLWRNEFTKQSILLELKTKKKPDGSLNIDEVGQGFNHLEWSANAHSGEAILGLIFVCMCQKRSQESAPSNDMWLANLAPFRTVYDELVQMLYALQRLTPLQRIPEMQAVSERAEWQPDAIFARLRGTSLAKVTTT